MKHLLWDKSGAKVTIVIPAVPTKTEEYAATELASYLTRMSSHPFIITSVPQGNCIAIGRAVSAIGFTPDTDLGDDGFQIQSVDGNIAITGSKDRGTLYGVYGFLEDFLGCRFFSPEIEVVPTREVMEIDAIANKQVPKIDYRAPGNYQARVPEFAAKRKVNGQAFDLDEKFGGRVEYGKGYFVHTVTRSLMKVEDYFDEHPEYFAEIDGVRIKEKTQLCLTNPDVLKICTNVLLDAIRKQPEAKIWSVSQEDNYNGCTCEKCRALDEYEGSQSGSMLHFVNAIAEEVEKEFPDVIIDTLAYQYTRRPPKHVRARKNVSVRLCTIECCFLHPLSECTVDDPDAPRKDYAQSFRDDLIEWGKKCDHIAIWDYITNFSHYWMPHPNMHVLAENIKFFSDNHATSIFEQGCGHAPGGEMNDLRGYILAKALWNPEIDPKKERAEFLAAAYGDAAYLIDEYLETVYRAAIDCGGHLYCFNHPDKPWHKMELVEKCEKIFDEAKKVAADEVILNRIKFQEMAVRYLRILLTPKYSKERNDLIDVFEVDAKNFGITMLWERENIDYCLEVLRGQREPGYWWGN